MNVLVEGLAPSRRRHDRHPVAASAAVRGEEIRIVAEVQDLSEQGARLITMAPLTVGTRISLKLAFVDTIDAEIVWVKGLASGCAFDAPLHPAILEVARRAFR